LTGSGTLSSSEPRWFSHRLAVSSCGSAILACPPVSGHSPSCRMARAPRVANELAMPALECWLAIQNVLYCIASRALDRLHPCRWPRPICAPKKYHRANKSGSYSRSRNVDGDTQVRDHPWLGGNCVAIGTDWVKSPKIYVGPDESPVIGL
jgi:hypothetical protein